MKRPLIRDPKLDRLQERLAFAELTEALQEVGASTSKYVAMLQSRLLRQQESAKEAYRTRLLNL